MIEAIQQRAITYSLLAHIRNGGELTQGPVDIFGPLIKRAIAKMASGGIYKGESLQEVSDICKDLYGIDFPVPVLSVILLQISKQINTDQETYVVLHADGSFEFSQYTFDDYEKTISNQEELTNKLNEVFRKFCDDMEFHDYRDMSIVKFVESCKFQLGRYFSVNSTSDTVDYSKEAKFIEYFKRSPIVYRQIQDIYLGCIISSYLTYTPKRSSGEVELLMDTNFIISLLDLSSEESAATCKALISLARASSFTLSVLPDTIRETSNLLKAKAANYRQSFLIGKVLKEDIYSACARRNLNRADLERIADNLESLVKTFAIRTIANTDTLRRKAKSSPEYPIFLAIRNSQEAAIHDTIGVLYVKQKRGGSIADFERVNCWFVNRNSIDSNVLGNHRRLGQPEIIRADELLSVLWLSNPSLSSTLSSKAFSEVGLTSIIAQEISKDLPRAKVLRELDDNIVKYARDAISDADIVLVSTRIANNEILELDSLNDLARKSPELFIKRLEDEASKQKSFEAETMEHFTRSLELSSKGLFELQEQAALLGQQNNERQQKALSLLNELEAMRAENLMIRQSLLKLKRDEWTKLQIRKWQAVSWGYLAIVISVIAVMASTILHLNDWSLLRINERAHSENLYAALRIVVPVLSTIVLASVVYPLINKYTSPNQKKAFIDLLEYPPDLSES